MTMARVVALIVGIHLEQILLLPLPCYGGEKLWDLILLDLGPVTRDDQNAVNDAIWRGTGGGKALGNVAESLRDL